MGLRVPLLKPRPDFAGFLDAMDGRRTPARPPLIEYLVDDALMRPILEKMLMRPWVERAELGDQTGGQMDFSHDGVAQTQQWLDNLIAFWLGMGYDFVRVEASLALPAAPLLAADAAPGNESHTRAWQGLHQGPITSRAEFESYPWPTVRDSDFFVHEYLDTHLPSGMGLLSCHAGGVYEHTSRLMGYEGLCYALEDDLSLVVDVANRIGALIEEYNRRLLQFGKLGAILQGEDLGFNAQTLIPPDAIRRHFLPWHKKYAAMAHDARRRYYFHSCGQVEAIMEDLIVDVKIDGKHSFQDNVTPVVEAKRRWGNRIAILGGVDVDKLTRLGLEDLRRHVRGVIDACAPGGRFAIGSGNSIPSYVPVESYLTMIDEALR